MNKLLLQHKKYYAIALIVETLFVFITSISSARDTYLMCVSEGIKSSAMDGFFISSVSFINFTIPFIVLLCNFIIFKDDFDAIRISRYEGKMKLFNQQLVIMCVQCFYLTLVAQLAKWLGMLIITHTLTNTHGYESAYYLEFTRITGELPAHFNWVKNIFISVVLNSSGTYIRVAIGLLIYWITNYQPITFLVLIAFRSKFSRVTKYYNLYGIRFDKGAFYTELVSMSRIVETLAMAVFVLALVEVFAMFIIPRKDFLKN